MNKILLIPAIVLLFCCVIVGAFNAVTGSNNRPMTFNDSLVTLSEVDLSIDDMLTLIESIQEVWGFGQDGDSNASEENSFGQKNYQADSGAEWLNNVLNFLSDLCFTLITLIKMVILIIDILISIIVTLFDLTVKFFFGVPT